MENISSFLQEVVFPALATIVTTAITLYVAIHERRQNKKDKAEEEKEKENKKIEIIKTCIQAVEQMHKDLKGEAKLKECIKGAKQMLETAGILISDFELKMRIEEQLCELNNLFENTSESEE